jgi:hypothetical protein
MKMPPTDEQLLVLNSILYFDKMKGRQSVYAWALNRASHYAQDKVYAEMSPEDQQHLADEILTNPYVYHNIVPVKVENTPASIDPDGGQVINAAFSYKDPDAGTASMPPAGGPLDVAGRHPSRAGAVPFPGPGDPPLWNNVNDETR